MRPPLEGESAVQFSSRQLRDLEVLLDRATLSAAHCHLFGLASGGSCLRFYQAEKLAQQAVQFNRHVTMLT